MGFLILYLFVWLVGMIPFLGVFWLTRFIRACWLRQLPRAFVAALCFAPISWSDGPFARPVPPHFVLRYSQELTEHQLLGLLVGPVAACFLLFYCLAFLVCFLRRKM